jgi:cobalt/nickel transport system ATP-binding protein
MSEPLIQIDDLSFAYPDGTAALTGVSLHIVAGEKVALAGANGAGKSTLLGLLCGALPGPWAGTIRAFSLPVEKRHLREIRRRMGMVFQNPDDQLFCPTVFDDVAFGPRNMKLDHDEVHQRVTAALAAIGLAGFERRTSYHLSLGEKKRAAIATVLSMQPDLLALDEPTSMLDPRGRREIRDLLRRLGGTQIVVTHDLAMIRELCSRVVVLSRGQVAADGPPAEVLSDATFLEKHGLA